MKPNDRSPVPLPDDEEGAPFFTPHFLVILSGRGLDAPADPAPCPLGACHDPETCSDVGRCCARAWHNPTRCSCGHVYDAAASPHACPGCGLVHLVVMSTRTANVVPAVRFTAWLHQDSPAEYLGVASTGETAEEAFTARCDAVRAEHPGIRFSFTHRAEARP